MSEHELTKEERILRAVKQTLTRVIKDTATQPGLKHPLSEPTIEDLRHCLVLISERERELAEAAGRAEEKRPYYVDEPRASGPVEVPLTKLKKKPN